MAVKKLFLKFRKLRIRAGNIKILLVNEKYSEYRSIQVSRGL